MKKILTTLAVISFTSSAFANYSVNHLFYKDQPPKRVVYKDQPPENCWTGFYAGLNGGYLWGTRGVQQTGNAGVAAPAINNGVLPGTAAKNPQGYLLGGQIGFNYQFQMMVFGIEADIAKTNANDHQNNYNDSDSVFGPVLFHTKQSMDYFGTIRARVGFLSTEHLMGYLTGGFAYAKTNLNSYIYAPPPQSNCTGYCGTVNNSRQSPGWTAGFGVEYLMNRNVSGKIEYLYFDVGRVSKPFTTTTNVIGANVRQNVRYNGNVIRVGVDYHFV